MVHKNGTIKIWAIFAIYFVLFVMVAGFNLRVADTATASMWLILSACIFVLSVFMLIKYKLPSKNQIIISLVFGLLMFAPFVSIAGLSAFLAVRIPIVTFLSAMAFFSISNHYPENTIVLIKNKSVKSIAITIALGLAVGITWGIINIFLNSDQPSPHFALINFIVPLNPGIYEEMAFRAFIFAACLHFIGGKLTTKWQRFTVWFMMVIPHVLPHTPSMFIEQGIIAGIISTVILTLVFGLPFALLQRKRDITSAMIAHGVVMIIFFSMFGISMS
ncbi:MAG: CPBP family glutamic-type intramembrane protease [Defluviitaleaceae bacterium]|nr:CPBP family glutamic-type intramembrane protease [Defluviitaleaceae bacterium]